jgi:hypothetical protein
MGFIAYEVPEGAAGPAGVATPPAQQPGAPGQGPEGQGNAFRTQHFPNVSDEHWQLIEPHMQGINRYVTQQEQRYAPFKSYTPEAVQGLAQFAAAFDRDPQGAWIQTAKMLQAEGRLNADLDLDHLEALLSGQDPEGQPQGPPNGNGVVPQGSDDPQVQELLQRIDNLERGREQEQLTQRQRTEDAALKRQVDWMKAELKRGGVPEDAFSDERLLAAYIAHRGNAQLAVKSELDYRNATLKGFANPEPPPSKDLDLPRGAPGTTPRPGSSKRGMFSAETTAAAEQALRNADR